MTKSLPECRIGVVGSGAVGCYYGGMLAQAGHDVRFLMRADLETVRREGLKIHTKGEWLTLPVPTYATPEEIGVCDFVLVALKTTANAALGMLLPPLLGPETAVVTLQNGLGNEEFLAAHWGAERVLGGLCFVCLNRTAPGVIEHYDHGTLSLGEFRRRPSPRLHALVEGFRAGGIEAIAVEDLVTERWRKLLWNIPFNGLSIAAHGATVDKVLASEPLRTLARDLMEEARLAAAALGHDIPSSFADFQIERSWSMGAYKPSSMIDWTNGSPVEVEAIWGEPLRQGEAAGVAMGRLRGLYALLQYLTGREGAR